MDTALPSTNYSLFNIPQLAEDGTNWITYKERIRAIKPKPFKFNFTTKKQEKDDGTEPTQTEIEDLDKKIDEFYQKDSLVKQQIFSTITDWLLLSIQKLQVSFLIWVEVCAIHEGKTELVQIDL
ncbi:hypothetical protein AZE42_11943 [Rhizopogon vesiculosus]|uniref:Uncharacterized protein n=1 Tax=Rhizopogon vesiculosus TaxID=180088 RepID=A0A1J8PP38_9AGAM|nr:hypothetical protein AZE42_11943 [Rhizopogon vesiculosus]